MLNLVHLSRTDLNLLIVFGAVFEERHVARAANRLNLTPSAISHALMRLRRLFNDPLFLRMPRGVSPTARALEIAAPVADILGRIDHVVGLAAPFDAATSNRRFTIGVPDAVMAPLIEPLLKRVADAAPNVDIGIVHVMPDNRSGQDANPWQSALEQLDTRDIDIAILPVSVAPARFNLRRLHSEDFVVVMRRGHPFKRSSTLAGIASPPGFAKRLAAWLHR